jgi:hypothetical protein
MHTFYTKEGAWLLVLSHTTCYKYHVKQNYSGVSAKSHDWFVVVDLEKAAAVLDRMKRGSSLLGDDRAGSSWWPWRDTSPLVVSWLEHVISWCGSHSFVALDPLPVMLGLPISYTLPASRTRPNAARRCYAPHWLARRQDSRRLALRVKLLCGRFPQCLSLSFMGQPAS